MYCNNISVCFISVLKRSPNSLDNKDIFVRCSCTIILYTVTPLSIFQRKTWINWMILLSFSLTLFITSPWVNAWIASCLTYTVVRSRSVFFQWINVTSFLASHPETFNLLVSVSKSLDLNIQQAFLFPFSTTPDPAYYSSGHGWAVSGVLAQNKQWRSCFCSGPSKSRLSVLIPGNLPPWGV